MAVKELAVWEGINQAIKDDLPVALLLVTQSTGSSPGRRGFKMAVLGDGRMIGSIGGGIMEYKLVERARAMLAGRQSQPLLVRQEHRKEGAKNRSGMICSGEQSILIWLIPPGIGGTIASIISKLSRAETVSISINPDGLELREDTARVIEGFQEESEGRWSYQEILGFRNHAFIVGGGHVSLALSRMLNILDFQVSVLDNRPSLWTMDVNQFAHQRIQCSYDEVLEHLEPGPNNYLIIMTFGYRDDGLVLRQVLDLDVAYIGMMGSAAKVEEMKMELIREGYSRNQIERVRAPVGLPIKSQTPDEIAISIAAELIQVKNSIEQKH